MEKINYILSQIEGKHIAAVAVIAVVIWIVYELLTAPTDHNGYFE